MVSGIQQEYLDTAPWGTRLGKLEFIKQIWQQLNDRQATQLGRLASIQQTYNMFLNYLNNFDQLELKQDRPALQEIFKQFVNQSLPEYK